MLLVVLWLTASGCLPTCQSGSDGGKTETSERESAPPVRRALGEFLKAVQYRDVERAWKWHAASTKGGAYCRSEAFAKVLERTRKGKTERDCRDARKMGEKQRARLADDAALLVQILRFACEQPDGDCVDYQKRVFASQFPDSSFWTTLEGFEVRDVRVDDAEAKAYVDYWSGKRRESTTEHRTLALARIDGRWVVETIFGKDGSKVLDK